MTAYKTDGDSLQNEQWVSIEGRFLPETSTVVNNHM